MTSWTFKKCTLCNHEADHLTSGGCCQACSPKDKCYWSKPHLTYTWRPVSGKEVEVILERFFIGDSTYTVRRADDELGVVWRDERLERGWRWRRSGEPEVRGGGLNNRDMAVSALLFALRQEGKV